MNQKSLLKSKTILVSVFTFIVGLVSFLQDDDTAKAFFVAHPKIASTFAMVSGSVFFALRLATKMGVTVQSTSNTQTGNPGPKDGS